MVGGGGPDISAAVKDGGNNETARFQGTWGKQGGWDTVQGCPGVSPNVFRCSRAVVHGPEWGRAGDTAVVDGRVVDDVAGHVDA